MQEHVEELDIYMLFFDIAGYGDSDANPKRSLKSDATDVEELTDMLQLGDKFYVVGCSMGGYLAWRIAAIAACTPPSLFRLARVALAMPVVNYWWPLPANVSRTAYGKLHVQDHRTFWITHHAPSLLHAWLTQKSLSASNVWAKNTVACARAAVAAVASQCAP
ncbi:uncharacterized protein [Miscanthus floridulus]|uniref:uncharacterized protein n=1 Tax=Miscanthus floridulus TaxID=154761 RepID=UPI0034594115